MVLKLEDMAHFVGSQPIVTSDQTSQIHNGGCTNNNKDEYAALWSVIAIDFLLSWTKAMDKRDMVPCPLSPHQDHHPGARYRSALGQSSPATSLKALVWFW